MNVNTNTIKALNDLWAQREKQPDRATDDEWDAAFAKLYAEFRGTRGKVEAPPAKASTKAPSKPTGPSIQDEI